jgi:predicted AlkP superfamily phosphohydrolase/phosphomutase/tetratricopeptide (TPR) repeat protein
MRHHFSADGGGMMPHRLLTDAAFLGDFMNETRRALARKVLLVGWDAADWMIIDPLLQAGKLPFLASLMKRGVHGNMATLYPALSPLLWTSVATGKRADRHGILHFVEPTQDGRSVRPVTNLGRQCKALWNILHQNGKRSAVIGWWPSHPAEPIHGVMVSDMFAKGLECEPAPPLPRGAVWPPEWAERIAELRTLPVELPLEALRMFIPKVDEIDQRSDPVLHHFAVQIAETMSVHAAATEALGGTEWDFAAVYYNWLDHIKHGFMRYYPPRLPWVAEDEFERFRHVIDNAYCYQDAMLGRLLALAGDDAHVLVMSDHGFLSDHRRLQTVPGEGVGAAAEHRHFGIFCLAGPGIRSGEEITGATLLDIAPTILHLFGIPAGADMEGKLLRNAFRDPADLATIPSWEDVPGDAGCHPPGTGVDSVSAAEAMQQLIALGYLAPPDGDLARHLDDILFDRELIRARVIMGAGRTAEALPLWQSLHERRPDDIRALQSLIELLLGAGSPHEAARILDEAEPVIDAAAIDARDALSAARLAKPDDQLRPDLSEEDMREQKARRQLAEKAPGYAVTRAVLRAKTEIACGRPENTAEIIAWLESMAGSTTPGVRWQLAMLHSQLENWPRALHWCHAIVKEFPDEWQALTLMARLQLRLGEIDAAIDAAVASLSLVHFQPETHLLLGRCFVAKRAWPDARSALFTAISQAPAMTSAWEELAELYDRMGLPREAEESRRRIALIATLPPPPAASPAPARPTPAITNHAIPSQQTAPDPQGEVVIVSGLPRSGTSMMMQMLAAGGVPAWSDGDRTADDSNPHGYFELTRVLQLPRDQSWLAEGCGKALKVVAPLLRHLPASPKFRVVFMTRPIDDVLRSQRTMLQRTGQQAADDSRLSTAYSALLGETSAWLASRPDIAILPIAYDDVIQNPAETAEQLASFLGRPFKTESAAASVDRSLRRSAG